MGPIWDRIAEEGDLLHILLIVALLAVWNGWSRSRARYYRVDEEFKDYLKRQKKVAPKRRNRRDDNA